MAVRFRICWWLFLLTGVLPFLSQASQNQSNVTSTLQSTTSVTPTQLTEANQPVTTPREFKGTFTITNHSWKPEYANVKTTEYKTLKSSLESEMNNALENVIPGFVTCIVQWFYKGSVVTHFAVYVSGNQELTSEKLQNILLGAWSSGSLASYSLDKIVVNAEQNQEEQVTEETAMFLKWELWKIISLGGLIIVFILLIIIIVLAVRNRMLKKNVIRQKRTAEERHQRLQQQQQVPSRAAFSIIAASSAEELATILQKERRGQVQQFFKRTEGKDRKSERFHSYTYSAGTSPRLVDLLKGQQQTAIQQHRNSAETQLLRHVPVHEIAKEDQEIKVSPSKTDKKPKGNLLSGSSQTLETTKDKQQIKDSSANNKKSKSKLRPASSVVSPSTLDSSTNEEICKPSDTVTPRKVQPANVSFVEPQVASDNTKEVTTPAAQNPKQKDENSEEENDTHPGEDKPKILSKVQAFEQGPVRDDKEREEDRTQDPKREPKKLKHIQFHSTAAQPDDTERRKRQSEIRPLGGVVKPHHITKST